jgi:hypothetical protein
LTETEMRVAFLISDFSCDPDEVTERVGVPPSEVFRRGEVLGRGPRTVASPVWRLQSPVDTLDLDAHVSWLLDRLPSSLQALRECTVTWDAQLAVAVHVVGVQGAGLAISKEHVVRLAALGASVDVDLYCRD